MFMLYNVVVQGCQHQVFFKEFHNWSFLYLLCYNITVIYIKLVVFNQIDKYFLSEMGLKIRGYNV